MIKRVVLSKKAGWVIFLFLLFVDAFLDVYRGVEGNPLWIPVVNAIGINYVPFLVPFVFAFFFVVLKVFVFIVSKVEKIPRIEELLLSILVVCYGVFDLWLVLVAFFRFSLFKNFYQTIPVLIAIGLAYGLWAEYKLKHK